MSFSEFYNCMCEESLFGVPLCSLLLRLLSLQAVKQAIG